MANNQKREDRGLFVQLPVILFDQYADKMPATSFVAFIKFYRHFGFKGIFKGSIRKLCNVIGVAKSSIQRAIADWVRLGLVRKGEQKKADENRDEMVLLIEGNDLWGKNIEHSKSLGWCPKLGQSASAGDTAVPENKGSVPDWDTVVPENSHPVPNRDGLVPDGDDFVPTSSSKSPPKIKEDYLEITLDKTEDSDPGPPSSQPDASLHSSFLDKNIRESISPQEDTGQMHTNAPSNDASPIAANPQDMHNEHNSASREGGGYKTENSSTETQDSDALSITRNQTVMENSTMRTWVEALASKERFFDLGKPEKREEAIKQLESIISSEKDLRGIYGAAREIYGGIIHLTNLTNLRVVNAWLETKPEYEPSDEGMTLAERDQAKQDVWDYDPDIALSECMDQGRWFVGIFISQEGYFELGAPDDWKRVPSIWKAWAVQYGRRLSGPQQQREAIAV